MKSLLQIAANSVQMSGDVNQVADTSPVTSISARQNGPRIFTEQDIQRAIKANMSVCFMLTEPQRQFIFAIQSDKNNKTVSYCRIHTKIKEHE
ncbi:hypothetical protein C0557_12460 [Kosakonia sp. MUSA4]|nr:hypothetical protein C0557_12460 [Kosakonia sp. MUSA4]